MQLYYNCVTLPIDITSELANFEISDGWLALVIHLLSLKKVDRDICFFLQLEK